MNVKNKKGISEVVSYVLLIIIAVSLSVLVYNFLYKYIPKGEVESCPDGVSLVVSDIKCSGSVLDINITNKGLWTVSAAYLRVGPAGKTVRASLSSPEPYKTFSPALVPGNKTDNIHFSSAPTNAGADFEIEVQPAVQSGETGKMIACTDAIIVQSFNC